MKNKIRIGTRSSDLSIVQTKLVAQAIQEKFPQMEIELVCRRTEGDRILDKPLLAFGGKGVFVSEFEEALLAGEIDFAVHSAKDLPLELAPGTEIIGVLPRGASRDVLVTPKGKWSAGGTVNGKIQKEGRIIGTSSLRRKIQIEELAPRLWPGERVYCENLRGNVLTRLQRLDEGRYDGIILAEAGLERLDLLEKKKDVYGFYFFAEEEMIPAGGQGILVIQGCSGGEMNGLIEAVSDQRTMFQFCAEREVLAVLKAGCHEPAGVYCRFIEGEKRVHLMGIYEKCGIRRRAELEWEINEVKEEAARKEMAEKLAGILLGEAEEMA